MPKLTEEIIQFFHSIGKYKILSYTSPPALLRKAKQGGKKIASLVIAEGDFLVV